MMYIKKKNKKCFRQIKKQDGQKKYAVRATAITKDRQIGLDRTKMTLHLL